MQNFKKTRLLSLLIFTFTFQLSINALSEIGLLSVKISFDMDDRSDKEKVRDMKARLEEMKKKNKARREDELKTKDEYKTKDEIVEEKEDAKLNEYEEQFLLMIKDNLV